MNPLIKVDKAVDKIYLYFLVIIVCVVSLIAIGLYLFGVIG